MVWSCEWCGHGAAKEYPSAAAARRYAVAFDQSDTDALGKRAPLLGMFPLRLWYWWRHRNR